MWICPKCKEGIEDEFDTCWKCAGAAQEATAAPQREKPLWRLEFICLMLFIIPPVIAFQHRNDGGDRLRAEVFDLSVMAVGAVGLVAVWVYRSRKRHDDDTTAG